MSIFDLMQQSEVEILKFASVKKPNMDLKRQYRVDRVMRCRCVGVSSFMISDQYVKSAIITHKIFFGTDPRPLDETYRLRIEGCFFRPVGGVIDSNLQKRLWFLFADSRSLDNENIEII